MPSKLPASSISPEKNARFSGRFERCTLASSSFVSSRDHLNARPTTSRYASGVRGPSGCPRAVRGRGRPRSCGCCSAKPRCTTSTSATMSRFRFVVSRWALPPLCSTTSDIFGSQVTAPAIRFLPDLRSLRNRSPAAEAVLRVNQIDPIRVRRGVDAADGADSQARLLRQVADEEIHLGELRGRDHLALERVDPLDVAPHHETVGAAREADLRRHDDVELRSVDGEDVGGRDRRGQLALIQRGPVLTLADRQLDLEPVLLEEDRVLVRLEAAVGGDQPGIARVLADLDRDVLSVICTAAGGDNFGTST